MIFLCSYYSEIDKVNGLFEKYTTINVEQQRWLKNCALNAPFGTDVIIFSHALPKSRFETGKDPFVYEGRSTEPILMILQQARDKGITVAAWFCGAYGYDAKINVADTNFISIGAQLPYVVKESKCENVNFLKDRTLDTKNQDCWNAVIVKPKEKTIKIYRFGGGEDIIVNY